MRDLLRIEISKNRIYGLDILRALAILFVVYGHGTYLLRQQIPIEISSIPVFDGVSIFFVLSGFLIGGILIKTINKDGASAKNLYVFWKRRWYRTLPNYLLILSIVVGWYMIVGGAKYQPDAVPYYYTFLQNFNQPHPAFFGEAWSLAVEEWFYLIAPVAVFSLTGLLRLDCKKVIPFIAIGFILGVTLIRYYRFANLDAFDLKIWDITFRKQVITRLDSIMYGVLGAYAFLYLKKFWASRAKVLFFVGIAGLLVHRLSDFWVDWQNPSVQLYYCVFSFSLVSISTLLLIPYLNNVRKGSGFVFKCLTYISLISYSMYLINLTIVQRIAIPVTLHFFPSNLDPVMHAFIGYTLFWAYTIVGSILLYKYVEMPFMKLRDVSLWEVFTTRLRSLSTIQKSSKKSSASNRLPTKD